MVWADLLRHVHVFTLLIRGLMYLDLLMVGAPNVGKFGLLQGSLMLSPILMNWKRYLERVTLL